MSGYQYTYIREEKMSDGRIAWLSAASYLDKSNHLLFAAFLIGDGTCLL